MEIIKRNGRKEQFNPLKIKNAIKAAFNSIGYSVDESMYDEIVSSVGVWDNMNIEDIQDKNIFSEIALDMTKTQKSFDEALKSSKGGSFDIIFDTKLADNTTEGLLWHVVELKDGSGDVKGFLFVGESVKDLPRFRNLIYGPQKHT